MTEIKFIESTDEVITKVINTKWVEINGEKFNGSLMYEICNKVEGCHIETPCNQDLTTKECRFMLDNGIVQEHWVSGALLANNDDNKFHNFYNELSKIIYQ